MPTRYIKETICTSEQVNKLTMFSEIVFYRLMVVVDDYGRMDGRLPILKSRLFPLKDVRTAQLDTALKELSSAELVEVYTVDDKPFVRLTGWLRHQKPRAKESKYPAPDGPESVPDDFNRMHLHTNVNRRIQPYADVPVIESRTSEIESKKNLYYNSAWRTSARARSSVAQNLIDDWEAVKGKTDDGIDAHSVICMFLEAGMEPETIETVLRGCSEPAYLHTHLFTEAVHLGIADESGPLRPAGY